MTVQWSSITIPHARANGNTSIRHNSRFILCCNYHLAPLIVLWHEEYYSGWGVERNKVAGGMARRDIAREEAFGGGVKEPVSPS